MKRQQRLAQLKTLDKLEYDVSDKAIERSQRKPYEVVDVREYLGQKYNIKESINSGKREGT
ncbi:hypothetical protein M2149_000795 [Lachnospiraceae bacterium PFB1-21]